MNRINLKVVVCLFLAGSGLFMQGMYRFGQSARQRTQVAARPGNRSYYAPRVVPADQPVEVGQVEQATVEPIKSIGSTARPVETGFWASVSNWWSGTSQAPQRAVIVPAVRPESVTSPDRAQVLRSRISELEEKRTQAIGQRNFGAVAEYAKALQQTQRELAPIKASLNPYTPSTDQMDYLTRRSAVLTQQLQEQQNQQKRTIYPREFDRLKEQIEETQAELNVVSTELNKGFARDWRQEVSRNKYTTRPEIDVTRKVWGRNYSPEKE